MSKVLTIIIPTYNMEEYLHKCLASLLIDDHLLALVEVLIINDGSEDRSSEIALSFVKKYPDVFKLIEKENGNYGSCVNRGLKEARGKYVKLLDADDEFVTDAFARLVFILQTLNVDLVLSDVRSYDTDGNQIRVSKYPIPNNKILSYDDAFCPELISGLFMHNITYLTALVIGMNYRQTEGIFYTDNEWAFVPMLNVKTLYYHNEIVYSYLRGRPGQTMDPVIRSENWIHDVIGIRAMVKGIIDVRFDTFKKECFIFGKLLERIRLTYGGFLFDLKNKSVIAKEKDKRALVDLDSYIIENHPVLSQKMEDLSYGILMKHFIRKWRNSHYEKSFSACKRYLRFRYFLRKYNTHCLLRRN